MSVEDQILLTPQGYARIEGELDKLRTVSRREVAERIRDSKQYGELTENSEYEDAKNQQAIVEGRIQELRSVLQNANILSDEDIPTDYVGIGSIVTVQNLDYDDEWEFTVVGAVESDPDNDRISDDSPVGQALLGCRVGDLVDIEIPDGRLRYKVEKIRK